MSELRTNLLSNAAGTGPAGLFKQSAAKAWVAVNYSGGVPFVGGSVNASSLTDVGVGLCGVNYTNAFASAAYAAGAVTELGGRNTSIAGGTKLAASVTTQTFLSNTTAEEDRPHSVTCHGDLA
jgi:hypothetical protein